MSIRQTSTMIVLLTLCIGGSLVLGQPLFKNNRQTLFNSQQLLAQNSQSPRRISQREKPEGGRILQELNLTEQQKQQLEAIKQQYEGQIQPLRDNLKIVYQDLGQMMAGTASVPEIRAKHQELVNLRQQMGDLRFEGMLAMREILTPEQRNKFAQLMEQHRDKFHHRSDDPSLPNE
ncbi:protein of unknown function Spy-related [Gloeothece citriformis PCC 7424]|uniref:Periplasmic heavy metal sensor n=2 Tax=Gloeothece TaxID=28070 RepID=B7KDZ5_GLOC7|nr:protein of unknown function Spy-related [Gloeothece citriformis PCC 7424]